MQWIDAETGRPYSDKEIQAMKQQAQPAVDPPLSSDPAHVPGNPEHPNVSNVHDFQSASGYLGDRMAGGVMASLKRTYLGLKQLATYMGGDEAARNAINEEIARMEEAYGPDLATPAGKVGNIAGVVSQFAIPGMAAAKAGRMLPAAAKAITGVTGASGSVGRAALTGGAFEAAQPVQPGNVDTGDYALQKAGKIALGAGTGAVAGVIANKLTRQGVQPKPALSGLGKEAQRLGFVDDAALTPAQRTGDTSLLQREEGLLAMPGSSSLIRKGRDAQQSILDRAAAKSIGQEVAAPNEAALAMAKEQAVQGYKPIASIKSMAPDHTYIDALQTFAKSQATRATGSVDAARVSRQLRAGSDKMTGDVFLEELQGVRDMAFDATRRGEGATAKQLRELGKIMEDFAARKVEKLSLSGEIPKDAMQQLKDARTAMAKIHAIEKAVDPVTGKMSAAKFLNQEFKRQPASSGKGTSPVSEGLREVGDIARVLRQTGPYIGSSGTAERMMGQKMIEMETSPLSGIRSAIPIVRNYLAAQSYLKHGGEPGLFPGNMLIRRLLPRVAIGSEESLP